MEEIKAIAKRFLETQPQNSGKTNQPNYDEPIEVKGTGGKDLEKFGIYAKYKRATFGEIKKKGIPASLHDNVLKLWQYADNIEENAEHGIGLLLKGGVGTGKSTLAVCVMREAMKRGVRAYFLPMASLVDTLLSLRDKQERWKFEKKIRETPLLVLDDLGAEAKQDWVVSKVDAIITERNNRNLPTIITTNLLNDELKAQYTSRTYDRLKEKCAVINFVGESMRENAKIIVKTK